MCTGLGSGMGTAPLLYTLGDSVIVSRAVNIPPLNSLKFSPSGIGQPLHSQGDHLGAG